MYEAQAADSGLFDITDHYSTPRLAEIKASIKLAIQKRNYLFARKALGYGLYTAIQMDKKIERRARPRRASTSTVTAFMDSIKRELGDSAFDTFMSVNGEVTLMFAIDDTGSMSDTIEAAKDIATSIINHPRKEKLDYILSPFNDPGTVFLLKE